MEKDGVIEKCPQSPWNSPIVLVTKPDKYIRFCCDFRGLTEVTIKDSQALPRIDDSIEALSGSKWWSCLDMKSGYWQLDIAEKDRQKLLFLFLEVSNGSGSVLHLGSVTPQLRSLV